MPGEPLAFRERGALVGFQVVADDRYFVAIGGKKLVDLRQRPENGRMVEERNLNLRLAGGRRRG